MIPISGTFAAWNRSIPRASGDDPNAVKVPSTLIKYSPRERG